MSERDEELIARLDVLLEELRRYNIVVADDHVSDGDQPREDKPLESNSSHSTADEA